MAKKIRRGNRVQRFRDWSPEHKQAILDKLGVSLEDFRSYGGGKKERVLNRAFDGQKPSGGGSNPSQPKFDRNDPAAFTAPLSYNQTVKQGNAAADLVYAPQQQILQQQATNIPSWFDQYRSSLSASQTQQQQMTQPMLDQTSARADNQTASLTGADPNSQVGHDDVLAAAGRKALIEAGLAALQGTTAATQGYLAGRVGVANTAQQQALTDNTTAQKGLAAERGSFLKDYVGTGRENERKFQLESKAFGLDTYQAGIDPSTGGLVKGGKLDPDGNGKPGDQSKNKDVVTSGPFAGLTNGQIKKLSPAQKTALRNKGKGPKGPTALQLAQYDVNKDGKLSPGEYVNRPGQGGKNGGKDEFGNTPEKIRTNNNYWKSGQSFLKGPGKSVTGNKSTAIAALQGEQHIPYDIAVILYDRVTKGYLTPKQAKRLHRLGIKLKAGVVRKNTQNLRGTTGNAPGVYGQNRPG